MAALPKSLPSIYRDGWDAASRGRPRHEAPQHQTGLENAEWLAGFDDFRSITRHPAAFSTPRREGGHE